MSYVEVFKVEASGDVVSFGEARNNHAFAPLVWEILGAKYRYLNSASYLFADPGLEKMWQEWPAARMPRLEQVLLGATFDRVWIKRDLLPSLIEGCEWFLREHVLKPHPSRFPTVFGKEPRGYDDRAFVGVIAHLKEIYEDPTALGAAFNCCSANAAFWDVRDLPDTYEASEPCEICLQKVHKIDCSQHEWENRPYNVLKDGEHTHVRGEPHFTGQAGWELSTRLGA